MKKLNQKKLKWIVKEGDKRNVGFWTIARTQKITKQHAYRVYKKYKGIKEPKLLSCGRKPKPIADEERKIVIDTFNEFQVGATMIEQILDERGVHINHNRIHRILLEAKLAKNEPKKKNRRKWVRYERKHSLNLGHADWFTFKGKECILFIDDASRFITGYGEFENANTKNTIEVFKQTLKHGIFKQLMTDHGVQFVSNERENCKTGDSEFTELIKNYGTQHIKSRIKHPQSNGKAERAVGTIKRLWTALGSLKKTVEHYNYKRPHRSLTNEKLRTPYQAFLDKARKAK
ncbi:MAG: IS481 family transposase [Nanoarchaeota archaeon]|nr:IS481 family transposase [Nanoarchaeota archaeon]